MRVMSGVSGDLFRGFINRPRRFLGETGFLLLQAGADGPLVGILTLHDILRAQQAAAEEGFACVKWLAYIDTITNSGM